VNILTLPWRYAGAKRLRTLLLASVFALGLASMTGLYQVSGLIAENLEKKLLSYGANILVTPRRETLNISYGGYSLGDVAVREQPIDLARALRAIGEIPLRANIAVVAPKMLAAAALPDPLHPEGSAEKPVALVGVDWSREYQLKGYWEVEGALPEENGFDEILAGSAAAREFALLPGRVLEFGGRSLKVSGVLRPTGSDDDTALFIPLALAQSLSGRPGQAAFLEVAALCSGCPIEDIVLQLQAALPDTEVRALAQVAESRMYAVRFAQNLAFSVSLVILITACAMLTLSMFSAVAERRREIGVLRAVGFSRRGVFTVFVAEALGIGLLAGTCGYALGLFLADYVLGRLRLAESAALFFDPAGFALVTLAAMAAAAAAAVLPAWRAARVEPGEALTAL
jgi:putative ABC transport system permease protein